MKVLVIGSGAREHALCWKLAQHHEVLCTPGNAGTARVARNVSGDPVEVARKEKVDLVVVGPEAPLAEGIVDALKGVPTFGPTKAAAQLESSKAFSKDFMRRHAIPTAEYETFDDAERAIAWVKARNVPMVVKADGLAAGKGVVVAESVEQTIDAIRSIMIAREHGTAGARVVVEEILRGPEVSYHVVSDGERFVPLAAAQDHKRLGDGDRGPNTGGMGAYSPPPMVTPEIERRLMAEVVEPTLRGMKDEGNPFTGVLFVGAMIVDGAPRVLEYNVRFGDPETEVIMARWDGDVLPLLSGDLRGVEARWSAPAALAVVMASEGYPGTSPRGRVIEGLDETHEGVVVFEAGTTRRGDQTVTNGGRVLAVTGVGRDIDEAAARAYAAVGRIRFEGAQFRRDIGWQARR
jgi:phosphoribosylamine--glycine ligase